MSEYRSLVHPNAAEDIKHILSLMSDTSKNMKAFASVFLQSMSIRSLSLYSHQDIASFVEERYYVFQEALKKGVYVHIGRPKREQVWLTNKQTIEVIYPDAPHLFITLESLFHKFGLRITRKLHPVIGVSQTRSNTIKEVHQPSESGPRYSYVYVEFQEIDNAQLINDIDVRIRQHMLVVQQAAQSYEQIITKVDELKEKIPKAKLSLMEPKEEWINFLDWLKKNFYFFGYTRYPLNRVDDIKKLQCDQDEGLGLLSSESISEDRFRIFDILTAHVWRLRDAQSSFAFDQIKAASPIQRFSNLMRLSLRLNGQEHIFLGLLRRSSLQTRNIKTPLIHLKMKYIFETKKMLVNSYDYNQVLRIFRDIPKYELFRTPAEELRLMVEELLSITNPNEVYCFVTQRLEQKMLRWMIVLPPKVFNENNVNAIEHYLTSKVPYTDYELIRVRGDDVCRLHVYFYLSGNGSWFPNIEACESEIRELIKPWEQQLCDIIYQQYPGVLSEQLVNHYMQALPDHYRARNTPQDTVNDIMFFEKMTHEGTVQFNLSRFIVPNSELSNKASLLHVYSQDKIDLIHLMPVLQNAGLYVIDQLTARVGHEGKTFGFVQSYRVTDQEQTPLNEKVFRALIVDLLTAVVSGHTENDPLNALTISAQLDWRAINVIQLYRNFYLQLMSLYSREKMNEVLLRYPASTRLLFEYFQAKFSPDPEYGNKEYRIKVLLPKKESEMLESLRAVDDVDSDMILKSLFDAMKHTLRTNFYIPKGQGKTYISIKVDSGKLMNIPAPAPYREIYVHDAHMEGVHLRFGKVARGGLRWSDRLDDFRTEVLGLVKTQQTKNVVIVPVGSKGGFVIKKKLDSRENTAQESKIQYKRFISALLDISDNVDRRGQVVHPHHTMVYDEIDPYLVVAADKGTATFSDTANHVSEKYKFWLADAFASGGSEGYDHKKEGITARGAWECVKLHFKELGRDIQKDETTVAGVGDMSGDVFGNGMLLSKAIKLQAAFNHMHIFIDPDPDPIQSWKERQRLFNLNRSTWADYRFDLISKGGGVFDRNAKEILISPEMKRMLDINDNVLNGGQLIQAILKMRVDLFWFGGIGTYVKSEQQTNLQVGDKANDSVRISASDFKALVVGEGANLAMTQSARIAYNLKGGHCNTDAIDNSAGVNMSDYEVNIKILLQRLMLEGHITSHEHRNQVLANATNEVSELVLRNNRGQHRLISMDWTRSQKNFKQFINLINHLSAKNMNRRSEYILTPKELNQLELDKKPLPRSVLSVLQAYVKMMVSEALLDSELLDDVHLEHIYEDYFPKSIKELFQEHIESHKLRREIIATELTNKVVNQTGINFFYRMEQLTGASIAEVMKLYLIFDKSIQGDECRMKILGSKNVKQPERYQALIKLEEVLQSLTQGALQHMTEAPDFSHISTYKKVYKKLIKTLAGSDKQFENSVKRWERQGFPKEIASLIASTGSLEAAPEVVFLHNKEKLSIQDAYHVTVLVRKMFDTDWVRKKVVDIEVVTDWEYAHQDMLLKSIESTQYQLLNFCLSKFSKKNLADMTASELLQRLSDKEKQVVDQYFNTLAELKAHPLINLSTLSVCIHRMSLLGELREG